MNLGEVINLVDQLQPNAFPEQIKTHWINTVEGFVHNKVIQEYSETLISKVEGEDEYLLPFGITIHDVVMVKDHGQAIDKVTELNKGRYGYIGIKKEEDGVLKEYIKLTRTPGQDDMEPSLEIIAQDPYSPLSYEYDKNKDLLVPEPYSNIYITYVAAQIDFHNKEFNSYNNGMQQYNTELEEFLKWWKMRNPIVQYKAKNYW